MTHGGQEWPQWGKPYLHVITLKKCSPEPEGQFQSNFVQISRDVKMKIFHSRLFDSFSRRIFDYSTLFLTVAVNFLCTIYYIYCAVDASHIQTYSKILINSVRWPCKGVIKSQGTHTLWPLIKTTSRTLYSFQLKKSKILAFSIP
jgi:hypothetical protein